MQAKTHETFIKWVDQLKVHRLYRQHVLTFGSGSREGTSPFSPGHNSPAHSSMVDLPSDSYITFMFLQPTCLLSVEFSFLELPLTPPEREVRDGSGSLPRGVKLCSSPPSNVLLPGGGSSGRLSSWIVDSQSTLESLSRELSQAGQTITQMNRMLEQIESLPILDIEVQLGTHFE